MAWRSAAALVVGLALAISADAAQKNTKRFVPKHVRSDSELGFYGISRNDFLGTYKRLGILTPELPTEFRDRDDARQAVEEAVSKYLKLAKIDVVSSAGYAVIADRLNRESGGIYDARTGELKPQIESKVIENARREFISNEHLDGVVRLRVIHKPGDMQGMDLYMDGVSDSSFGSRTGKGEGWDAVGLVGTLGTLSLQLDIFRNQDRVMFGRYAGIQPSAYARDIKGQGVTLVGPRVNDLLRDVARLDRAALAALVPLLYSPLDVTTRHYPPEVRHALSDPSSMPPLPEPVDDSPPSPLVQPRDIILKSVHRVALSSVRDSGVAVPEAIKQQILSRIRSEIAPLGWEIIDAPRAEGLLIRQVLLTQLFDPYTGRRNEEGLSAARKSVFELLDMKPPPEAILWVSVEKTRVMNRKGDVVWDGSNQNARTLEPVKNLNTLQKFLNDAYFYAGSSSIDACSVQVVLTDSNDATLYRGRGGVQILQKVMGTADREALIGLDRSELFQDSARVDRAVQLALHHLVLTPEALATELNAAEAAGKADRKARGK